VPQKHTGAELRPDAAQSSRPPRGRPAALDAIYPDARNPFAFPELRLQEGLEA
jgi:hypothetical protein